MLPAVDARSQTALEEAVHRRPRPDFEPNGAILGDLLFGTDREAQGALDSFVVFPALEIASAYDDNLFRRASDKLGDFVMVYRPSLNVSSDWDRHALTFSASSAIARFFDEKTENYEDFDFRLDGVLDIGRASALGVTTFYLREHVPRDVGIENELLQGEDLQKRYRFGGRFDFDYREGDFRIRPRASVTRVEFSGEAFADPGDDDRTEIRTSLRAGYEAFPGTLLFLEPGYVQSDFRKERDTFGIDQDLDGWNLLAGFSYDLSAVSYVEVSGGFIRRTFDDAQVETTKDFGIEGRLVWNVSPLVTFDATISRDVEERRTVNSGAAIVTAANAALFWDPRENLIVSARMRLSDVDFLAETSGRDDRLLSLGFGIEYRLTPNIGFEAGYEYVDFVSNSPGINDYTENILQLRLGLGL